uniref:Collagen triple helix repeat-containing protein n=1 Tax=Candidatus Kentrum sp. MB TaxID=2138164 RepID=A0A451BCQ8_9GAMM|nr:MAG: Collagen triple helix repeat-containing protein [Candidatus Kentron sp. MB]VFK76076.1 MAG: Collagen triple helix repeat-containing protein [Candidatus Kentron sp. MB]
MRILFHSTPLYIATLFIPRSHAVRGNAYPRMDSHAQRGNQKKQPVRPFIATLAILLLTLAFLSPARAAEHIVNFESNLSGWSAIKGTSYFNWARHAGGTHSGHTGPADAHEGNYYLYLEASRNTPGRIAYLQSPDFPARITRLSFYYHMYGAHMGTLELQGFDGNRWVQLWRVAGQQHGSHNAPWTRKEIDLSARTIRKVRFKGVTGSGPGKLYRGDMAIDYLVVTTDQKPQTKSLWSKLGPGNDIHYAHGNVGIGTNQPTADLAVLGNLSKALTGVITVPGNSIDVTGVGTKFTRELATGDSLLIGDKVFLVARILGDKELNLNAPHPTGILNATAYTDSDLLSVRTGAEVTALAIDKSGNIGIGTKAPTTRLDVRGGIRVGAETRCDAQREGTIRYSDTNDEVEFCNGTTWMRVEGPMGAQGKKGDTGAMGPQGPKGNKGDAGAVGPRGPKGAQGPTGPKGDKGDIGPKGLKGDRGPKGDKGIPGPRGFQGLKGDTGSRGPKGDRGYQGYTGATGSRGPMGPKGEGPDYVGNWKSLYGYSRNSAKTWNISFVPSHWVLQWRLNSSGDIYILPNQKIEAWSGYWNLFHTVSYKNNVLTFRANVDDNRIIQYWNGYKWNYAHYDQGYIRVLAWK